MTLHDGKRVIGDYRLQQMRLETPMSLQWEAEQVSVGRRVLVDELKTDAFAQRARFMADVRAKAAIDHPLIASVYEAVDSEEQCYYAYEYLPGASLEVRREAGEPMNPLELTLLMRRVAEIHIMFERNGQSTAPMNLEHLHVDSTGVLRVANLVVDGERGPDESARDMTYLGRALLPLVADGKEGTTRMLTLLAWMRGETDDGSEPLSWQQVIELCARIERQLTGEPTIRMIETPITAPLAKNRPVGLVAVTGLLGLAVLLLLARELAKDDGPKGRVELPVPVSVPASPADGGRAALPAFLISAHEVTIGEYHEFLLRLDDLKRAGGNPASFDHSEQPAGKPGHEPDDWENLLAAARKGKVWNGYRVSLDTPVVGVDWWDATAYCLWRKGRLPSEDEWLATLGADREQLGKIKPAAWGSINPQTEDRSSNQVLNLAGSVSEWTRLQTADPVNPLGAKKWLVLGGSYKQSDGHALSREWLDDRGLRRDDLGFRVVFDTQ